MHGDDALRSRFFTQTLHSADLGHFLSVGAKAEHLLNDFTVFGTETRVFSLGLGTRMYLYTA